MYQEKPNSISVIVLNYNGLQYLKRVLPELLDLQYANYEVVVVDNGSTDGSLDYIKSINVRTIISPRTGEKNFACNFAIENVNSEFIFLMDNDVVIQEKTILQNLITRFYELNKVGQIGLSFINEHESTVLSYGMYLGIFFSKNLKPIPPYKFSKDQKISYADGKAFFIKKSTWTEVGGYDEFLKFGGDDNDLGIRLWIYGYNNYLYSDSVQVHIGMAERTNILKYSYKFRKMVFGHMFTITKNYTQLNLVTSLPAYMCYSLLKAVKQSIWRFSYRPLMSWILALYDFFLNIKANIQKRKNIRSARSVKNDIFFDIDPPIYPQKLK